jgi:hypothetical protein
VKFIGMVRESDISGYRGWQQDIFPAAVVDLGEYG